MVALTTSAADADSTKNSDANAAKIRFFFIDALMFY
jgi:hypothetical protein